MIELARHRLVLLAVVALGALGTIGVVAAAIAPARVKPSPCGPISAGKEASSRLRIAGNRMQDSAGHVVTPYGVSVVGGPQTTNWARTEQATVAQIVAAHRYWHANAVRLQLSEGLFFDKPTRGHTYNVPYAKSVDRLVCRILAQGDIAVVNDMTLFTGWKRGPTEKTIRFWRYMSTRYGDRFPVIFDLYNEPQLTRHGGGGNFMPVSRAWRIWRSGGTVGGVKYVGMQDLVDEIRIKQRVRNVIWAEEPYYVKADQARFDLLPSHLLKGSDIVYAFHKPNMDERSRSYTDVRAVARTGLPLIDSEWGQFAAIDRPWMCQADAYRTTPPYLKYLRDQGIGMLSWSLQPGALVKGLTHKDTVHDGNDVRWTTNPRDLAQPTEMKPNYGCTRRALGQGAGRLVMDYFKRYSARPPRALFPKIG